MFGLRKKQKEENLKPLSERDIQHRLYGGFRVETEAPVPAPKAPESPRSEPAQDMFAPPRESMARRPLPPVKAVRVPLPSARRQAETLKLALGNLRPQLGAALAKSREAAVVAWDRIRRNGERALERIPLSLVTVSFFSAVLLFVAVRAAAKWISDLPLRAPRVSQVAAPAAAEPSSPAIGKKAEPASLGDEWASAGAPILPQKFYTIQLVSYGNHPELARELVARLKAENLDGFFTKTPTSRGDHYQVFLGHFTTEKEARDYLAQARKMELTSGFADSFVRVRVE